MKIHLAGFNTDIENRSSTPETLSAAYARISRDPRPIYELRAEATAEVEKARESNRTIVFGYGHGSVAEHAVFNFDILDISRLAAEALQSFRLASFTEKSQRYIRIGQDLVIPTELDPADADSFKNTASELFCLYDSIYRGLRKEGLEKERAKEDARYVLPLATSCQMGMTVNARELEHMVRRMSCSPFAEVRQLSRGLLEAAMRAAPSLFLFLDPTAMDGVANSLLPVSGIPGDAVQLIESDDDSRIGILLIRRKTGMLQNEAAEYWRDLDDRQRIELFQEALAGLGLHDAPPRTWEFFRSEFSVVISATAYAQLKRHRICSRLESVYDPALGVTLPESIRNAGLESDFSRGIRLAEECSGTLGTLFPYCLTNAHRRYVILQMNGRELYHFSRLRQDAHAQWDIRKIADRIMDKLFAEAPLTFMLAGGKSDMKED